MVARGPFQTVTLRREPEAIAFTAPSNASGLFELEPDNGMLLPFGGMGVDTVWRLELPKPANPFDFRTVTDVLLTLEIHSRPGQTAGPKCPAPGDPTARPLHTADSVVQRLRPTSRTPRYDLNNPDYRQDPARRMRGRFTGLTRDDSPPTSATSRSRRMTLFAAATR